MVLLNGVLASKEIKEQLIYKREGVEIIFDVTELDTKKHLEQSIELMRMIGFSAASIEKALDEFTF